MRLLGPSLAAPTKREPFASFVGSAYANRCTAENLFCNLSLTRMFRSLSQSRRFATELKAQPRAKRRIQVLTRLIKKYNDYYFNKSIALIPDEEYDLLVKELTNLEKENPELASEDSPTKQVIIRAHGQVGAPPRPTTIPLVTHAVPMISLANTYSSEELHSFAQKCGRNSQFTTEAKYDGVAVSVTYRGGRLFKAATRGDGKIGSLGLTK